MLLALHGGREELLLLRRRAMVAHEPQVGVGDAERRPQRSPGIAEFLHHHRPRDVINVQATVGFRQLAALAAEPDQAPDDVQGNGVIPLARKDLRFNFLGQIFAHGIAKGNLI